MVTTISGAVADILSLAIFASVSIGLHLRLRLSSSLLLAISLALLLSYKVALPFLGAFFYGEYITDYFSLWGGISIAQALLQLVAAASFAMVFSRIISSRNRHDGFSRVRDEDIGELGTIELASRVAGTPLLFVAGYFCFITAFFAFQKDPGKAIPVALIAVFFQVIGLGAVLYNRRFMANARRNRKQ